MHVFWSLLCAGNLLPKKAGKNSTRLVISAVATVGALLLVALMCFWGCFLYKNFGKNDIHGLHMDVSGGTSSLIILLSIIFLFLFKLFNIFYLPLNSTISFLPF
jgi:hypothetical protein